MTHGPLKGKSAMISGASGGVGLLAARALAGTGASVIITGRSHTNLEKAAGEIENDFGTDVRFHATNPANRVEAEALVLELGDIDVFVSCSGNLPAAHLTAIDDGRWRKSWEAAMFQPLNLVREIWPGMSENENGLVIIVIDAPNGPDAMDACASVCGGALMSLVEALGRDTSEGAPKIIGLVTGRECDGAVTASAIARIACEPERFSSGALLSPGAVNEME